MSARLSVDLDTIILGAERAKSLVANYIVLSCTDVVLGCLANNGLVGTSAGLACRAACGIDRKVSMNFAIYRERI